jgi:hypothetical protein
MCLNAPVERVDPEIDTDTGPDREGEATGAAGADDASAR